MGIFIPKHETWPPTNELRQRWHEIEVANDLWQNREHKIRAMHVARNGGSMEGPYFHQPLAQHIAIARANLLAARPFEIKYESKQGQQRADELRKLNNLNAVTRAFAEKCSAEGGVYWRVIADPSVPDGRRGPLMGYVGEKRVLPTKADFRLTEATVIHAWRFGEDTVVRQLEHNKPGFVQNEIWVGTLSDLGDRETNENNWLKWRDWRNRPIFAGTLPEIETGVNLLPLGYIRNRWSADRFFGVSDFEGLLSFFLELNRTSTFSGETMEALLPVILMDEQYLGKADPDNPDSDQAQLPTGVKVAPVRRNKSDGSTDKPWDIVQGQFDWKTFEAREKHLIDMAIMYGQLDPGLMGRVIEAHGGDVSGIAKRIEWFRSIQATEGVASNWEEEVAKQHVCAAHFDMQRVASYDGNTKPAVRWSDPDEVPAVNFGDPLPEDPMEAARLLQARANAAATLKEAGLATDASAVEVAYPDKSPAEQAELVEQLAAQEQQVRDQILSTRKATPAQAADAAQLLGL